MIRFILRCAWQAAVLTALFIGLAWIVIESSKQIRWSIGD